MLRLPSRMIPNHKTTLIYSYLKHFSPVVNSVSNKICIACEKSIKMAGRHIKFSNLCARYQKKVVPICIRLCGLVRNVIVGSLLFAHSPSAHITKKGSHFDVFGKCNYIQTVLNRFIHSISRHHLPIGKECVNMKITF